MDANRSRGIAVGVFALMDGFGFQGAEDALHRCIVPAVWLAAHRWSDDGGLQDLAIIAGSVLTAAIRVMDQARPRTAPLDGQVSAAIVSSARICSRITRSTRLRLTLWPAARSSA